ncbi:hypothetical protein CL656_04590 [bacterium]|nr:hypothetical protein [bacterium]|tara:strand:+ start:4030 stop:5631 length:1602 start_codon:yes stop_codon:yes gene_type:complete
MSHIDKPIKKLASNNEAERLDTYLSNQFNELTEGTFSHSLSILRDWGLVKTNITAQELISQDPFHRINLITEIQEKHAALDYGSNELLKATINILTKIIFFQLVINEKTDVELDEANEALEELNLDIVQPTTYLSKISAINIATQKTRNQANKFIREELGKIISAEDNFEAEKFVNIIMEVSEEDQLLADSIIREVLFETNTGTNILRDVFLLQDEYYGTYRPPSNRSRFTKPNNIDAACFAHEVDIEFIDNLIQTYQRNSYDYSYETDTGYQYGYSGLSTDNELEVGSNVGSHPIIQAILHCPLLRSFIFDEDCDVIQDKYDKRIEIITSLLHILMEKRDHWITVTNKRTKEKRRVLKNPYVESYFNYINKVINRTSEGLYDELKHFTNKNSLAIKSQIELIEEQPTKLLESNVELVDNKIDQNSNQILETIQIDSSENPAKTEVQTSENTVETETEVETSDSEELVIKITSGILSLLNEANSNKKDLLEQITEQIKEKFGEEMAIKCKTHILSQINLEEQSTGFRLRGWKK